MVDFELEKDRDSGVYRNRRPSRKVSEFDKKRTGAKNGDGDSSNDILDLMAKDENNQRKSQNDILDMSASEVEEVETPATFSKGDGQK